ncbi:MAG: LysR family transcriptional regulator [Polyangiaceae bacterium]
MMHIMNWDDLRFVAAVTRRGSLLAAARELRVEHTTVGRRIDAAEKALGAKLFSRSTTGFHLTVEGERLLDAFGAVEAAVSALERRASASRGELEGTVKVTSPETIGIAWLAPKLAALTKVHPGLHVDLDPSGVVMDLGRRQAEVAVRSFRAKQRDLFVRKVADVRHGLYATRAYLKRRPVKRPEDLAGHPLLADPPGTPEGDWLARWSGGRPPVFTTPLALAMLGAAKAGSGIALLPRYVGDAEADLVHVPMPDEPGQPLWLTVHKDLRTSPRVRAVLDHLVAEFERDAPRFRGRA